MRKQQKSDLESQNSEENDELSEVLKDPERVSYFVKFCEREFSQENIYAWLEISQFKKEYDELSDAERIARVLKITEIYLKPGSIMCVNLDSTSGHLFVRQVANTFEEKIRPRSSTSPPIEESITDKPLDMSSDIFDKQQLGIKTTMMDSFFRFQQDSLYHQMLKSVSEREMMENVKL